MWSPVQTRKEPNVYTNRRSQVLNPNLDLHPNPDAIFDPTTKKYSSADPRLYDVVRNIRLSFDTPPLQPKDIQPLKNIACSNINVPSQYQNYSDIELGNVSYYTTLFKTEIFPSPIYQIPSTIEGSVYTDPMGSVRPYYKKQPLFQQPTMLSEYTFDQDQMSFREDLMSLQSSKMDRRNFHKFHSFFHSTSPSPLTDRTIQWSSPFDAIRNSHNPVPIKER